MAWYDLEVHASLSIGEDSVEAMAHRAKRLGLSGMGLVTYFPDVVEIPVIEGIDIVSAVMIKPKNASDLNQLARRARNQAEVLLVHGGAYDVNRAACESPFVDVLCHPELGRKDSGIDHICARAAHENNVAIQLNFRELLESAKRSRVFILSSLKKNVELCRKYDAPLVVSSGAVTQWGLRSGRELASFSYLLGLELGAAIDSTSTVPESIVKKNREKLAGKAWEGVRLEEES